MGARLPRSRIVYRNIDLKATIFVGILATILLLSVLAELQQLLVGAGKLCYLLFSSHFLRLQ